MYRCTTCDGILPENAEDGFCSFDCENAWYDRVTEEEFELTGENPGDEDFMSQWDDDPNPYAGTYSEE